MDLEALSELLDGHSNSFVTAIRWQAEHDRVLDIEYEDPKLLNVRHRCEITCTWVKECDVSVGFFDSLQYLSEHPLLLPHFGPQGSLFFSSSPSSPESVIVRAQAAIHSASDGWLDPRSILNGPIGRLLVHLHHGSGLLARGPVPVLDAIASAVGPELPCTVTHGVTFETPLRVLLLNDRSIICRSAVLSQKC
ncbi:MAG: hypothetical protein NTV21_08795 [Planctomycetota bacterium]|nr:hypothetical protein [Planctomycetota bacterium]